MLPLFYSYVIPDAEFFLCAFLLSIFSKISWGTFSRMNSSKKFLWNFRYSLTPSSDSEEQQCWPGLWVELAIGWPEKVGLRSSVALLWSELGSCCIGRGAVGRPFSILNGEDITFLFRVQFSPPIWIWVRCQSMVFCVSTSMVSMTRWWGYHHAHAHSSRALPWRYAQCANCIALLLSSPMSERMNPWER